jgi:formate hydrogenlyase subunit 4
MVDISVRTVILLTVQVLAVLFLPSLLLGFIRKTKANLQSRMGAPIYQPLLDLAKLIEKGEVVSDKASWVLRGAAVTNAAVVILIALSTPWLPGIPAILPIDIFLFIYLFVLLRFMTVLAALDTASPFGGFAASREVTLAVLVEPAIILCLGSLAIVGHSTRLATIFSFLPHGLSDCAGLWILAGCGLYMASLVELSRMPADDPTTHLELTMVHEAMILENSGPNLALTEYANTLKMLVLFGIAGQCFVHAAPEAWSLSYGPSLVIAVRIGLGILSIIALAGTTALIEATLVKLRWTKLPDFIAYSVTFGLLCAAFAVGVVR